MTDPTSSSFETNATATQGRTRWRGSGTNTPIPPFRDGIDTPISTPTSPSPLRHIELDLADTAEYTPKRLSQIRAEFFLEQTDGERVESLDVFVERVAGEVGVAF